MRRSFGPKMGGGGGGGSGGGGMMRSVHRAVRAGMGGGSSATRTTGGNRNNQPINTTLSLSSNNINPSSPCSYLNHPASPPHKWAFTTTTTTTGDEFDWEHVEDDSDSVNGFYDDFVFGTVPSEQEVHHAVSSLQEVLQPVSFAQLMKNPETDDDGDDSDGVEKISTGGFELDWTEPSMQLCYSTSALQVPSSDKVFDAFHMLQTDPSVQRMVISLSSDKAVWDAVMNNEVVRELREAVSEDRTNYDALEGSVDDSNPVTQVLRWIFVNTKERVIEIVEKLTKVVNELVWPTSKDEKPKKNANAGLDPFDEMLRNSFFLSIVVLLIVVVGRSGKC